MQAIIGLSEAGLESEARQMLYALAAFPAKPESFAEAAALAVAHKPIQFLDSLVDAGLVECIGPDHYSLHQTIADYARAQYHDKDAEGRMARYYIDLLACQNHDYLLLEQDTDNILRALQLATEHGLSEEYLQGVLALVPFLKDRALYQLAEQLLEQAKPLARLSGDKGTLITLLLASGQISLWLGNYQETEVAYQESLQLARQSIAPQQICLCLLRLGGLLARQGDFARTEAYFQEGLQLARQIHSEMSICALLNSLGAVAANQADFALAEHYWQEAMTRGRQAHFDDQLSASLAKLGALATEQGNFLLAETYFQEGLQLARKTGNRERIILFLLECGNMLRKQQKYIQARASLQEGLDLARQMGHQPLHGKLLLEMGGLALQTADLAAAEATFREIIERMPERPLEAEIGARYGLAQIAALQGRVDEARALGEQCLASFVTTGHYRTSEVRAWLQSLPAVHMRLSITDN